jgi:protein HIRA/HIR1
MVIAEIPLWVVHSSSSGNDGPTPEDWNALSQSNTKSKEDPAFLAAQQALQSYYYVPPSVNSKNSESVQIRNSAANKKKCAIYSVDVFQNLFCTAGGDGTVRIWNVQALFSGKKRSGMAHFDAETGRYVSSESSESQISLGDEDSDRSSSPGNMARPKDSLLGSEPRFSVAAPIVHDLNANARSKKKAAVLSPRRPTVPSTEKSPRPAILSQNRPSVTQQQPRLLCTLSAHTGSSVLAVRFSYSGQYIASAGDDGCVCIYARTNAPVPENNSGENWSRIKLCRGHNLDVVDLAWSPDEAYLVSCSLDSATPIIVWKLTDLQNTSSKSMICAPFKILGQSEHTSTVKGVAFDPAGSYFASSGDDPAVCIWRTHDDWGLEKRIDADAGIFRKWNLHSKHSTEQLDDVQALSNQSLFRRISWSTDGAFLCSTNSVVKNKHVASTISRERWYVSGSNSNSMEASGAANLVGHKQPIVVSRHASHLLKVGKNRSKASMNGESKANEDDDVSNEEHSAAEDVPEYATLLALGDRRGFVSVWSTRKSRPIFKVQCSESHCTVTDLSWGSLYNGDLLLLVSLLDGQVYAFRFAVPDELGSVLTEQEKNQVFQLRYGIDIGDGGHVGDVFGQKHKFSGNPGPNLIENALQMSLEEARNTNDDLPIQNESELDFSLSTAGANVQQEESRSVSGKKRVRPILVQVAGSDKSKQQRTSSEQQGRSSTSVTTDPLLSAIMVADKVAAVVENSNLTRKESSNAKSGAASFVESESRGVTMQNHQRYSAPSVVAAIRHSTERSHVADLPLLVNRSVLPENFVLPVYVVECVNNSRVPVGSKGGPVACVDIAIITEGQSVWKDQILGSSCSALSTSKYFFAVGLTDGSIQLYGTSPTNGWSCGLSFRSHSPLILGTAVVSLQFIESESSQNRGESGILDMLVVTADGFFGVWAILPDIQLQYKGSVMPAITHMSCSSGGVRMPTLSRVHVTDSGHLFLLLSLELSTGSRQSSIDREPPNRSSQIDAGSGGSPQGFVYDRKAELWLRVSDSRFVLSDFYTALPSTLSTTLGVLSQMDDAVRLGSLHSSLKAVQRSRQCDQHADAIYQEAETDSGNFLPSRSHCEDRMACALALKSSTEFKHWLRLYIRILVMRCQISQLRMLVAMILHQKDDSPTVQSDGESCWWWLSLSPTVLSESRIQLVHDIVIPEMSKSRMMQRLTNEIFLEIEALADVTRNA